jgi:hypothetical protein
MLRLQHASTCWRELLLLLQLSMQWLTARWRSLKVITSKLLVA